MLVARECASGRREAQSRPSVHRGSTSSMAWRRGLAPTSDPKCCQRLCVGTSQLSKDKRRWIGCELVDGKSCAKLMSAYFALKPLVRRGMQSYNSATATYVISPATNTVTVQGLVYRVIPHSSQTPLSTTYALAAGGRWHASGSYPVLYA